MNANARRHGRIGHSNPLVPDMQDAEHTLPTPGAESPTARGDGTAHPAGYAGGMTPRPRKQRLLRWLPDAWVLSSGDAAGNALYLTFDDGPHPVHTPRLLDLLASHGAKATFFVIGDRAENHPRLMHRIVEEGHALGNHSWSHPRFERMPQAARRDEMERTDRLLAAFDGHARHDFRPPRGVMPPAMLLDCALRGIRMAYWSYDSLDYSQRAPDDLLATMRAHPVRAGEIVLMHDDSPHSHALLSSLLPEWKAKGHAFRTLADTGRKP